MREKLRKRVISIAFIFMLITTLFIENIQSNAQITTTLLKTTSSSVKVIATGKAVIDGVSVRSSNSSSGKYLGSLYTGDKVEIVEKTSKEWYKIKYKEGYAYVTTSYIKLDGTTTKINVLNTGKVYNVNSLTVRKTSSSKSTKLGTLKKGAKVEIVDVTYNGIYKIKYKNSYGYVDGKYINLTKTTPVIKRGTVYNANSLTVRKEASTKSSKVGSLKKGATVQIVKVESKDWYKIKYGSGYGYVSGKYIKDATRKNLNNFLFIGDSFTHRIKDTIISENATVYVSAQSGSRPSYWIDKVGTMTSDSKVEGISLLIGVNGVKNTATNIKDTKVLIQQLMVRYPGKPIYVQKVFPVGKSFTEANPDKHNKAISEFNKEIKDFCNKYKTVKFIDATDGFISGGYLSKTDDGLHIMSKYSGYYYRNILDAIKREESK